MQKNKEDVISYMVERLLEKKLSKKRILFKNIRKRSKLSNRLKMWRY